MIQFCARATKALTRGLVLCTTQNLFSVALSTCALILSATISSYAEPPLKVLSTTSIIADTVREIAGEELVVESLMGPGVDPHLYKASPGDIRKLSDASLILHNGLHLEGKMGDVLEKLSRRKRVRAVTDAIPRERLRVASTEAGVYDPHVWFDVSLWIEVVRVIRDELSLLAPDHAANFAQRAQQLEERLRALHTWCAAQIQTIPHAQRILITAHDAFGYFSSAYGIKVMAIQGISTDSEASLREINTLVQIIVQSEIPAVFVESTLPPKAVEALVEGARAKGHSVAIGGQLLSDALGEAGTAGATYEGMVRFNVETIVQVLVRRKTNRKDTPDA
jgi:manganese/zinc/iron transport system substrate-binding protein